MTKLLRRTNPTTSIPVQRPASAMDLWDELFESFFDRPFFGPSLRRSRPLATTFVPALDLVETPEAYHLTVELPGMKKDEIEIDLREDTLVLRGEKKQPEIDDDHTPLFVERGWGRFERALTLPAAVNADKVKAKFRDGVLHVELPKMDPAQGTRRIEVSG
ncbi:MAG: Hsp20/alpha crystallin family protein [Planctomycetota bacterium]|nr:MAG: Hsp20/alpha crystallin family protein [Planctomycetota bacterium]